MRAAGAWTGAQNPRAIGAQIRQIKKPPNQKVERLLAVHGHPARGGPRRSGTGPGIPTYHDGPGMSRPTGQISRTGRVKAGAHDPEARNRAGKGGGAPPKGSLDAPGTMGERWPKNAPAHPGRGLVDNLRIVNYAQHRATGARAAGGGSRQRGAKNAPLAAGGEAHPIGPRAFPGPSGAGKRERGWGEGHRAQPKARGKQNRETHPARRAKPQPAAAGKAERAQPARHPETHTTRAASARRRARAAPKPRGPPREQGGQRPPRGPRGERPGPKPRSGTADGPPRGHAKPNGGGRVGARANRTGSPQRSEADTGAAGPASARGAGEGAPAHKWPSGGAGGRQGRPGPGERSEGGKPPDRGPEGGAGAARPTGRARG